MKPSRKDRRRSGSGDHVEDPNITKTLEMLKDNDLSTIERIILGSTDTVQSLLSVIFGTQIDVEVISQLEYDAALVRWANLRLCDEPDVNVALAESIIPYGNNIPEFIGAMGDRDIGIGQAINKLGFATRRDILGIHVDDITFARTYRITGDKIDVLITESFNRALYRGLK